MRCKNCGLRLSEIVGDFEYRKADGSTVMIVDAPIYRCKNCNEEIVPTCVYNKVQNYIIRFTDTRIEYRKILEAEAEDMMTIKLFNL